MRLAATTACSQSPDSKGSARHSPLSIPAVGAPGEAAVAARSDPGTGRSRWACGSPSPAAGPRASDPQASQLHRSEPARHSKTAAGHRARVGVLSRSPCRGNAQGEDPLQAWPTPASATAARASDAEGAEGSGGAVGLAVKFGIGGSHPLRVRLCGRALQAAELRGARAAAGRAGGRGACGRLRGAQAAAGRVGGVRGGAREWRPRSARAAVGRAGGCGTCGLQWGVRAAAARAGTQAAVVGRAGGRGACVRCRGRARAARAAKQVARATVGNH
jgi:hypothetical protein